MTFLDVFSNAYDFWKFMNSTKNRIASMTKLIIEKAFVTFCYSNSIVDTLVVRVQR